MEKIIADMCHDSDIQIVPRDIQGCHRRPSICRNSRDFNKGVIIDLVNKLCYKTKKSSVVKKFLIYTFMVRYLCTFLFVLTTGISGVGSKTCIKEKKFTQSFVVIVRCS